MKMIVAYIRPSAADDVLARLSHLKVQHLHYGEVRGYGRQKEHLGSYQTASLGFAFLPTLRLSFVVDDDGMEEAVAKIVEGSRTGNIGDGKILIVPAST